MVEKSLISPKSNPESVGTSKFQSVFPAPKQSIENTGPMRSKDATPSSHPDEPKVGSSICDYSTCAPFKYNSGILSKSSNSDPSFTHIFSSNSGKNEATINEANKNSTSATQQIKFSKATFPTTPTISSSVILHEHLKECMEIIKKLEKDNATKCQEIQNLQEKQHALEGEIQTLKSLFETKFAELEKAVISQPAQTEEVASIDATVKAPEAKPIVKVVVEKSDPKDDELKSIIAESQLLAENASQLNKRLLTFQANKAIATDDTSYVVADTQPSQKSNSEQVSQTVTKTPVETASEPEKTSESRPLKEDVIKPQQDVSSLSEETKPNLSPKISGHVSENPTKSPEPKKKEFPKAAADLCLSNHPKPITPDMFSSSKPVSTNSNQNIFKGWFEYSSFRLNKFAATRSADEPKRDILTPISQANFNKKNGAGKAEIKPTQTPGVEKSSKSFTFKSIPSAVNNNTGNAKTKTTEETVAEKDLKESANESSPSAVNNTAGKAETKTTEGSVIEKGSKALENKSSSSSVNNTTDKVEMETKKVTVDEKDLKEPVNEPSLISVNNTSGKSEIKKVDSSGTKNDPEALDNGSNLNAANNTTEKAETKTTEGSVEQDLKESANKPSPNAANNTASKAETKTTEGSVIEKDSKTLGNNSSSSSVNNTTDKVEMETKKVTVDEKDLKESVNEPSLISVNNTTGKSEIKKVDSSGTKKDSEALGNGSSLNAVNDTISKPETKTMEGSVVEKDLKESANKSSPKTVNNTTDKTERKAKIIPSIEKDLEGSSKKLSPMIDENVKTTDVSKTPSLLSEYRDRLNDCTDVISIAVDNPAEENIGPNSKTGFYKILLGTSKKGAIVYPKYCFLKLTSMYGNYSILSVVRNGTLISVCTRNKVVFQNASKWAKELNPALFLLDSGFVNKPKMILTGVPPKDVRNIRCDVEDSIYCSLVEDPVILGSHEFCSVVLITFKDHDDYVLASESKIYVKNKLCEKVEYRTQLEKMGWKSTF